MKNNIKNAILNTGNALDTMTRLLFIFGLILLVIAGFIFVSDTHYFYFSYLTSFTFYLSITLGAMFFVLIHYITSAGWSVVVRRIPEVIMNNVGLMALLCIPVLFGIKDLYHWSHLDEVLKDHLLQIKQPYLNTPFFLIRVVFYFVIWKWISNTFFKSSIEQDQSKDPQISNKLQKASTYSMILYGLTLTFAFIDFVMSLTSHWYSTIFGVYMFAGCAVAGICIISVLYMILRSKGFLKDIVNIEHYHDLGKLIYGFNIFWSYIAFCQFFLIWYANVPEETIFYAKHFKGTWNYVAILLSVGHFGIPFILFMSRWVKRNLKYQCIMAIWIVLMHFIDLYWIIMPNVSKYGVNFKLIDLILLVGLGCIFFGNIFRNISKLNLIPKNDPRLQESLDFKNF